MSLASVPGEHAGPTISALASYCSGTGRVVCAPAHLPASPIRPPCPPDKEISSLFEYIRAYSSIFEVFLKNIQIICPIRPVRARHNGRVIYHEEMTVT
jgi:hypothetical protein